MSVKKTKLSLVFTAVLAFIAVTSAEHQTLWIEQPIDNFNKTDTRTWQMRYLYNDEFYKPGGPLFIFVGAEWFIVPDKILDGHVYDMAKEHNGSLFYAEHRFFGKSRPFDATTNENLKYLNAQQALADLARFIRTMKATIPGMENSKAILIGYSYAGSLVTWFKRLYPDLQAGGWASSAILYAKADFYEFKEIMGQAIKLKGGEACYDRIARGTAELESMLANGRGAEIKSMLGLCDTFSGDNHLDVSTLFNEISEIFAALIQYHPNYIEFDCERIMQGSTDVIGLADYIKESFYIWECKNVSYGSYLNTLMDTSYGDGSQLRAWTYMSCNQIGWFQTSGSRNQPFGTKFPFEFFITLCRDLFGDKYSKEYIEMRMNETNKIFGGLEPEVENVYWTHGQLDGWRAVGIQDERATIIPDVSHFGDLGSISDEDSAELRAAKEKIAALVRKWLA